jgi:hypothetical protein
MRRKKRQIMSEGTNKVTLSTESVGALADELEGRWHRTGGSTNGSPGAAHANGRGRKLFLWGAASGLAFAFAAPLFSRQARPVIRGIVKGGLLAGKYIQKTASSVKEEVEDIAAEAKADLDRQQEG